LLLHTGADVGEVFSRVVRDVDFDRATPPIRYQRTKTERFATANKPRFVPMPKTLVAELRAHMAEHELRGSQPLSPCSVAETSRRSMRAPHGQSSDQN
jgi:integrase